MDFGMKDAKLIDDKDDESENEIEKEGYELSELLKDGGQRDDVSVKLKVKQLIIQKMI